MQMAGAPLACWRHLEGHWATQELTLGSWWRPILEPKASVFWSGWSSARCRQNDCSRHRPFWCFWFSISVFLWTYPQKSTIIFDCRQGRIVLGSFWIGLGTFWHCLMKNLSNCSKMHFRGPSVNCELSEVPKDQAQSFPLLFWFLEGF